MQLLFDFSTIDQPFKICKLEEDSQELIISIIDFNVYNLQKSLYSSNKCKSCFSPKPSEIQPHLMANEIVASLFMREL